MNSRAAPPPSAHPLAGSRLTPEWPLDNTLNLGAKVLAAVRGGTIDLHGAPVGDRCGGGAEAHTCHLM